jgi:hypothetical protein
MATTDLSSDKILHLIDTDNVVGDRKKRGRPKKNANDENPTNQPDANELAGNEEIILHLSITKNDIDTFRNGGSATQQKPAEIVANDVSETVTQTPLGKVASTTSMVIKSIGTAKQQASDSIKLIPTSSTETHATRDEQKQIVVAPVADETEITKTTDATTLRKYVKRINELTEFIKMNMPMYYCKVSSYPVDLKLFDKQGKKFIPKTTKICCWHDTEQFDGLPTFIPERYYNGEFYVWGCFCSFNCACAYNLAKNDGRVLERHNLLVRLFYEINKTRIASIKDVEINPAGERELLQKFGGPLTIQQFRDNAKILGRTYSVLIPSCHPIKITYSENTNSKVTNTNILNEEY